MSSASVMNAIITGGGGDMAARARTRLVPRGTTVRVVRSDLAAAQHVAWDQSAHWRCGRAGSRRLEYE
jgi:hypothetical protein